MSIIKCHVGIGHLLRAVRCGPGGLGSPGQDSEQPLHSQETQLSPAPAPASDRTTVDHNAINPKGSEDILQSHNYICISRNVLHC